MHDIKNTLLNTQYLKFVHGQCPVSFLDIIKLHLYIYSHVSNV